MTAFEWDAAKASANLRKHGVTFEDAKLVWSDPLHIVRFDRFEAGELRWHAMGSLTGIVVLVVVHTYVGDEATVRIVSARKATRAERRSYEDGDI